MSHHQQRSSCRRRWLRRAHRSSHPFPRIAREFQGWAAGTAGDTEDTLAFAELSGVRPMIETYPLEEAAEAYARMLSGKAEFRVVLTMSH